MAVTDETVLDLLEVRRILEAAAAAEATANRTAEDLADVRVLLLPAPSTEGDR